MRLKEVKFEMVKPYKNHRNTCQICGKIPVGEVVYGNRLVLNRLHRVVLDPNKRFYARRMILCTSCRFIALGGEV